MFRLFAFLLFAFVLPGAPLEAQTAQVPASDQGLHFVGTTNPSAPVHCLATTI